MLYKERISMTPANVVVNADYGNSGSGSELRKKRSVDVEPVYVIIKNMRKFIFCLRFFNQLLFF